MKQILESLLKTGRLKHSRADIEGAIRKTLWLIDNRSVENWFNLLWKQEFIIQPEPGAYLLNLQKAAVLDLDVKEVNQTELDVGGR